MIEVRNLRKIYGETLAVDGISFSVPQGEILGFLGPNGAGKTTTMRVLTGYTPATSGTVRIGGLDVRGDSRAVRAMMGYLPESAPVYGEMTVRGYVDFFAEAKGLRGSRKKSAVDVALAECGLEQVAGRLLMNLSKGFRQRAALAQAIVGDPKVLILDEPTVGLDPRQIREIRSLIRSMAGRRTIILSTHILPEVTLTCSRVLVINRGRIVASGTPGDLHSEQRTANQVILHVRGPKDSVRQTLLAMPNVRGVEAEAVGQSDEAANEFVWQVTMEPSIDGRASLARAVVEKGFDLLEIRSTGLSLEDAFIHLIADDAEEVKSGR